MIALSLITLRFARLRNLSILQGRQIIQALRGSAGAGAAILDRADEVEALAERFWAHQQRALPGTRSQFPGGARGRPQAQGNLLHPRRGYPAAEMKHGPIALIDENMPVVFIAPRDAVHGKIISNVEEVQARGGRVIAIKNDGDDQISRLADRDLHHPRDDRPADADPRRSSRCSSSRTTWRVRARLQRGPASEPRQVGDGGVAVSKKP